MLYCIIQTTNYIFLIFLRWETSDMSCRWRGYFAYLSICAVTYSYLIQAVSRLFIVLFSNKYRRLITFKTHYILILLQWLTVIIIPLPAIVTKDIQYRSTLLCWVPFKYLIHVTYTFLAYYIIPAVSICVIYIVIYYRVKQVANRAVTFVRTMNSEKRDLELLRNILIFLGLYLLGGLPSLLFLITTNKSIYLMSIVSISLTIAIEKICTLILDRDIRQAARSLISLTTRVVPFEQSLAGGRRIENLNHFQLNHKINTNVLKVQKDNE